MARLLVCATVSRGRTRPDLTAPKGDFLFRTRTLKGASTARLTGVFFAILAVLVGNAAEDFGRINAVVAVERDKVVLLFRDPLEAVHPGVGGGQD